jgi:4'-phosphopantetheinyl transferase
LSSDTVLHVWTVCLDCIDEARANEWRGILDAEENAQADRYAFASDRIQYLVAHALLRRALTRLCPAVAATDWRFHDGVNRKPDAWINGLRAPVSFNLSHTNGMVGVAAIAAPAVAIGFDLEALNRRVTLAIADRYFRNEEIAWLYSLPESRWTDGFLQLWTLKEAFIKATGEGLARDLASFWFEMDLPRIRFTGNRREAGAEWHFQQRVIDHRFIAALGIHAPLGLPVVRWEEVTLDQGTDHHLPRTVL